jgi:hypothetical protein
MQNPQNCGHLSKATETVMLRRLLPFILVVSGATSIDAQQPAPQNKQTSSLTGIVTDLDGMVIRNATVEAVNLTTNETKKVESGPHGEFRIEGLLPGTYRIRAIDAQTQAMIAVIVVDLKESIFGLNLSKSQSLGSSAGTGGMPGTRCTRLTRPVPRASMSKALLRGVKLLGKPFRRGKRH